MTAGYFSPLPPARTGVADYSAALLPHLRALGEVTLNTPAEVNLYHIGNNHLHREIYLRAIAEPGVVVLHDAVLQHFMLGTLDREAYIGEFVFNYGEWSHGAAEDLWRNRARSGADPRYFSYPMIRRLVTAAREIIVHNPAAAGIVRAHAPRALVTEIPHLFPAPKIQAPAGAGDTFLVGVFGHQRETKRLHVVLRAFHKALDAGADVRLLVAGAFVSDSYERSLASLLDHPRIERTGHLSETEFWRRAASLGACINLRYPTAAETSGIAISMMGIGKPVIFTSGDEIARYPESACLRIEPGPGEEQTLAGYLLWLSANPDIAAEIGRHAAAHIAREHAPEKVARSYWEVLCRQKQ
jgi:glycosyltransferase involved in cell wall biosynthesis